MTESEKELLLAYLVNQGLRYDNDVICYRAALYRDCSAYTAASLLCAVIRKQVFDKTLQDICALLKI